MTKKNLIVLISIVVVFGLVYFGTMSLNTEKEAVGIANPASVYCVDQGGRSEIVTNADGGQGGICIFSDGSECDEWAFFRKECAPSVK